MEERRVNLRLTTTVGGRPAPMVGLQGSLADALLGFASLRTDFDYTVLAIEAMQRELPLPEPSTEEDRSGRARRAMVATLWSGSVIRYTRCFESGYRGGYVRHLDIPDELAEDHRWFRDHRDEHIAHASRGNPFEPHFEPVAVLAPPPDDPAVLSVVYLQVMLEAMGAERVEALKRLATELAEQCVGHMRAIEVRIRELADERGLEVLYQAAEAGSRVRFDGAYPPQVPDGLPTPEETA